MIKILICPSDGFACYSEEKPIEGRKYILTDCDDATLAQNNAFHALITEYWRSGAHSYNVKTFKEFRDTIKRDLGAGFESYAYVEMVDVDGMQLPRLRVCEKKEDIPKHIWQSKDRNEMVRGRLKSWSDYTKKERTETIDRLLIEMDAAGVNSKKYQEIIKGMMEVQNDK